MTSNDRAAPVSIDQVVSDFDGVTFHVSTPEIKSKILISIAVRCFRELVQYGAQGVLEREYGPYIVSPEPGYDFSIMVDLDTLPAEQDARDQLAMSISLLKRNAMASPFEKAFEEFQKLEEESNKYSLEALPQQLKDGGEVMTVHYRDEEAIFIKAGYDCVTVIFSTVFRDETDRIFGKVFLQVCSPSSTLCSRYPRNPSHTSLGICRCPETSYTKRTPGSLPQRPASRTSGYSRPQRFSKWRSWLYHIRYAQYSC